MRMKPAARYVLAVAAVTCLAYLPAVKGQFLAYDDELLVLDNPKVHGLSAEHVIEAFTTFDPELFVPLTLLTYQVEWSLFGDNPMPYHVTNVLLHVASAVFVFLIARRFFSDTTAALCAALFALHPVQVEAVAWVSGRKDLLASMLGLASMHMYLRWKEAGERAWAGIVLFMLALLAKVSVAPLPVALLLLDWLKDRSLSKEDVQEKRPYFLLSAFFLCVAFFGKQAQAGAEPLSLMLLSFVSIPLSLLHVAFPVGLTIFYPFVDPVSVVHPRVWGGLLVVLSILLVAWLSRRKLPELGFAVAWFVLLLSPSLLAGFKIGELGLPDIYLTSDRYAYLALLGPVFLVGRLLDRRAAYAWAAAPVLAILVVLTVRQIRTWHDSDVLFKRVLAVGQPAHVAYTNLGGFAAQAKDYPAAEELYDASLAIRRSPSVLYNAIQIKGTLGKKDEARDLYEEYARLKPDDREGQAYLRRFTR